MASASGISALQAKYVVNTRQTTYPVYTALFGCQMRSPIRNGNSLRWAYAKRCHTHSHIRVHSDWQIRCVRMCCSEPSVFIATSGPMHHRFRAWRRVVRSMPDGHKYEAAIWHTTCITALSTPPASLVNVYCLPHEQHIYAHTCNHICKIILWFICGGFHAIRLN